jgi:hypothetical protein
MHAPNRPFAIWPVSLARIETVVSAHLGPGRVPGNAQGPCFSRQISMYLAKRVGRWSLSQIGRFYNGRTTRRFSTPSTRSRPLGGRMKRSMPLLMS